MKTIFIALSLITLPVSAWEGYDYNNGTYIEIDKGNLVRPGREIELYDSAKGEYIYVDVESIRGNGSGAELEVYDHNTGEYRTFDMD